MSISSLMSNDDGPVHRNVPHSRRSSRASNGHVVLKQERPVSPLPPHLTPTNNIHLIPKAPPSMNGDALAVAPLAPFQPPVSHFRSRADDREVEAELARIDAEGDSDLEADARIYWKSEYLQRGTKRSSRLVTVEASRRKVGTLIYSLLLSCTNAMIAPACLQRKAHTNRSRRHSSEGR
jgi:hypothetical protein